MPAREVSEQERMALIRRNLRNAAEITEAFRAAFEDGITINPDWALESLDELRNCIDSAYVDAFGDDHSANGIEIDVLTDKRPVRTVENTIDDAIN